MSARSFVLNKKRQGNITVSNIGYGYDIKLHNTVILKARLGVITLNSGGWRTVTTKTAINRYFNLAGLPHRVVQTKGVWYVSCNDQLVPFTDNMEITT